MTVNLTKQGDKVLYNLGKKLYVAGIFLEGEVKKIVAIDTGELHDSIKTFPVTQRANKLTVEVGTDDVEYAGIVEGGIGRVFNYHRNGSVVYTGDGQHYLERAYNDNVDKIINILKQ